VSKRWLLAMICLSGCASTTPELRGPRVTEEVRVCAPTDRFREGEAVRVMRRVCRPLSAKLVVQRCADEEVERGEIVHADEGCAVVRVAADYAAQPGDHLAHCNLQGAM
jgi:hypothetical protein